MAFKIQLDPYQPQELPNNVNDMAGLLYQQELLKPVEEQLPQEEIKNKLLAGLNNGNQLAEDWIKQNNIRDNLNEQQSANLSLGLAPDNNNTLQGGLSEKPRFWNELLGGYKDNYENQFNLKNFQKDNDKTWQYRLGEGLGTVGRFIDSPLGRGLIAGGLMALNGGSGAMALGTGLGTSAGFQNNQTADKLYRNQLKQYGYTDNDLAGINGFINNDTYKNLSNNLYRNRQIDTRLAIANAKDKTSRTRLILQGYKDGSLSVEDTLNELARNDTNLSDLNESNQTKNTNSQVEYRSKRLKQIDAQLGLTAQKIKQAGANSAAGRALKQQEIALKKEKLKLQQDEFEYKKQHDKDNPPSSETTASSGKPTLISVRNK